MKCKRQAYSVKRIEKYNKSILSLFAKRSSLNASSRGFTLVELIVSVGLFSIVMLVAVGALLALTGANRKAQALQSVMNNLNVALDGMVRSIRMGSDYRCGGAGNCPNGGTSLSIKPFCDEAYCDPSIRWTYSFTSAGITKSVSGGTPLVITSPEVTIDRMKFYVVGTAPGTTGDTEQPKVVITLQGTAGAKINKTKTTFNIQSTAVQRQLDL